MVPKFQKRQKLYFYCGNASLSYKGNSSNILNSVMTFIESMKSTLSRYSFNKKFVFNLDETPSDVKKSKSYKALLSKFLPKNNQCTPGMDYLRTILPVVSANGTIWAVFFIYKRSKDSDSNYIRQIPPPPFDHFQRGSGPGPGQIFWTRSTFFFLVRFFFKMIDLTFN